MFDVEAIVNWLSSFELHPVYVYFLIFGILLFCGFGLPIPEDITLIAAGILAGLDIINLKTAIVICLMGVLIGDTAVFLIGYYVGAQIFDMKPIRMLISPETFKKVKDRFSTHGDWVLFVARFLPGLRMPIFLTAGTTRRIKLRTLFMTDGVAALISVPLIVVVSYVFVDNLDTAIQWIKRGQLIVTLSLIVITILVFLFYKKKTKR